MKMIWAPPSTSDGFVCYHRSADQVGGLRELRNISTLEATLSSGTEEADHRKSLVQGTTTYQGATDRGTPISLYISVD
ncbi:hypothetical protein O9993_17995 [Vibrio lentus]|nr:hypothetical protein [Vibrio lentus]